jgi:hypothetical protein
MSRVVIVADAAFFDNSAGMHIRSISASLNSRGFDVKIISFSKLFGSTKTAIRVIPDWNIKSNQYSDCKILRLVQEVVFTISACVSVIREISTQKSGTILFYSPSVFVNLLLPMVRFFGTWKSILLQRDLVPESWCDVGLIKRGLTYRFLTFISDVGLKSADEVWIQCHTNYISLYARDISRFDHIKVKYNWLDSSPRLGICDTDSDPSRSIRGIYVGSLGEFQSMGHLYSLVDELSRNNISVDIYSSDIHKYKEFLNANGLSAHDNILSETIPLVELNSLMCKHYAFGLVLLNSKHTSAHVPGKTMTYIECGLPVYGLVNGFNDLPEIVHCYCIGLVKRYPVNVKDFVGELIVDLERPSSERKFRECHQDLFNLDSIVGEFGHGNG